jgi:hypothetical protein
MTLFLPKEGKKMAKGAQWELVCSEVSRPYAIETFRLKVPNGWIYCNAITRTRMLARDEFSQSLVFVPDRAEAGSSTFP